MSAEASTIQTTTQENQTPKTEAKSAFIVQTAYPPVSRTINARFGNHSQITPGRPAVIAVGGSEWTSKVPRNQAESDQFNAWANKLVSQNQ